MDNETKVALTEGVRERLDAGVSRDEIKQELLAAGYNDSDVAELLPDALPTQPPANQPGSTIASAPSSDVSLESVPPKKKRRWPWIILGIFSVIVVGWILLILLLPDKLIFRSYQSDLQALTEQYYEAYNGDYSGFCQSPDLIEVFDEIKVLANEVVCDSSPGGFDIAVNYDDVTYNCVPAVASKEMKNSVLLCEERSHELSDEEKKIREAIQKVADEYATMEPAEVVSRVEEITVEPTTHTFASGVSLAKMTLPYYNLPDEYDIDSAQMAAGKLVLVGGYLPHLVIVDGHVPACLQQREGRPQFHLIDELNDAFIATVHPQRGESYIMHGCDVIGGQYPETESPTVVGDDIAYVVNSDPRSSRKFLVYKEKEYAKYSSRIKHMQELDGEVAFVATSKDKDVFVIQKGDAVLTEIPRTESLAKFVTNGSNYFYMIRGRHSDPDRYFKNGEEVTDMPDELQPSEGYVGPFREQRLRAEIGGLVRFSGDEYDFSDLTFGAVDAYVLDNHLLAVVPQTDGNTFFTDVYFDPAAPWADRMIESVNFMYKYAGVANGHSLGEDDGMGQVQGEPPGTSDDEVDSTSSGNGDESANPNADQSEVSQLLFASQVTGTVPLTVTFQHSYEYPDTYAGSRELVLGVGDTGHLWGGDNVYHTFSEPGVYKAQLFGCDVTIDRTCSRVELDSVEIAVQAGE